MRRWGQRDCDKGPSPANSQSDERECRSKRQQEPNPVYPDTRHHGAQRTSSRLDLASQMGFAARHDNDARLGNRGGLMSGVIGIHVDVSTAAVAALQGQRYVSVLNSHHERGSSIHGVLPHLIAGARHRMKQDIELATISIPPHLTQHDRRLIRQSVLDADVPRVLLMSIPLAVGLDLPEVAFGEPLTELVVEAGFGSLAVSVILRDASTVMVTSAAFARSDRWSFRDSPEQDPLSADVSFQADLLQAMRHLRLDRRVTTVQLAGEIANEPSLIELTRALLGGECHALGIEAIARGAARLGAIHVGLVDDVHTLDALRSSVGIETDSGILTHLVLRDTNIPHSVTKEFNTDEDGQSSIHIALIQGDAGEVRDDMRVGFCEIRDIPSAPAGHSPIDVTFAIDFNGLIQVNARDRATGLQRSLPITDVPSALSSIPEIDVLVTISDEHAGFCPWCGGVQRSPAECCDECGSDLRPTRVEPLPRSTSTRVFISHASKDQSTAEELAAALESLSIRTWLATRDIDIGANYAQEIVRAIISSGSLVVILTPESIASPHVRREVSLAVSKGIPLLPVNSAGSAAALKDLPDDWIYWLNLVQVLSFSDIAGAARAISEHID